MITTKQFIDKSDAVHSGKYDYSEAVFTAYAEKVTVICHKHGRFTISATKHLHSSRGCGKCSKDKMRKMFAFTFEDFVEKANTIHNSRFKYSGEYLNQNSLITVTCGLHGDFMQKANDHLVAKIGCPTCRSLINNWSDAPYIGELTYLYFVEFENGLFKVGLTKKTLKRRFREDYPKIVYSRIWEFKNGAEAYRIEKEVLKTTVSNKVKDCTYLQNGNTEVRDINMETIIDSLASLCTNDLQNTLATHAEGRKLPPVGEAAKVPVTKLCKETGKPLEAYSSIKEAMELNNIPNAHIGAVCNGTRKTTGGFKWQYST